MDLGAIYTIWLRDLVRRFRNKTLMLGSFSRPILWLLILGTGLGASFGRGQFRVGVNFTHFIFPGIITMNIIFASMHSAISIIWDREFGFLKEILVAPISRTSIAIGKTLSGATIAVIEGLFVFLFAPIIHIAIPWTHSLKIIACMFLIATTCASLGVLIASRMRSFESFGVIVNFVIMPLFLMSGAVFPVADLPGWLNGIVRINPLTYGVDALRGAIIGVHMFPLSLNLLFLSSVAIVFLLLAVIAFNKK